MGWRLLPPSGPSWILPVSFTRHIMGGSLLPLFAPPKFSHLVFGGSAMFLIGTSCCETTHASGYHRAWPRWVVFVSVNGSLTFPQASAMRKLGESGYGHVKSSMVNSSEIMKTSVPTWVCHILWQRPATQVWEQRKGRCCIDPQLGFCTMGIVSGQGQGR